MEDSAKQPSWIQKAKDNFKTNETVNAVKTHFAENKKFYVGAYVGATTVLIVAPRVSRIINNVQPVIAPVFNNANTMYGGHLHKIVQDLETGEIFEQVGHLAHCIATEQGITYESARTLLSKHLNGHLGTVYGKNYRIIGIGAGY